jgi:hypothetical protein
MYFSARCPDHLTAQQKYVCLGQEVPLNHGASDCSRRNQRKGFRIVVCRRVRSVYRRLRAFGWRSGSPLRPRPSIPSASAAEGKTLSAESNPPRRVILSAAGSCAKRVIRRSRRTPTPSGAPVAAARHSHNKVHGRLPSHREHRHDEATRTARDSAISGICCSDCAI